MLGDYRILREVGRGGMGVVYEAEQLSLGRRVALKVLPFAAALDPRQFRRFRTEAQAAARLHHTNIVPVFEVGSERGVHYYAMQFIEGQSLAAMIADLRDVRTGEHGRRRDARDRRGTTGAFCRCRPARRCRPPRPSTTPTAGVVHRDIKPANLLVDARGDLWITDFGLARLQADGGLTLTGDLLGTLRYMSPEQALATRLLIDHRTDIYSLGATLYELLTLRAGLRRRATARSCCAGSLFDEPVPPRRIDPSLPRDLETIVLKAMAKEPADRYATAQELADDLRRFLEDKPIRARRPTPWAPAPRSGGAGIVPP